MKNLIIKLKKENVKGLKNISNQLNEIKSKEDLLTSWYFKSKLTKKQFEKLTFAQCKKTIFSKIKLDQSKDLEKNIQHLNYLSKCLTKPDLFKISIEWKKNRTWGLNPNCEFIAIGFQKTTSGSIGGCGYDKESAAFARAANQNNYFSALLAFEANRPKNKNKTNEQIFGYGVSGIIPRLSEGVGSSCYYSVCEAIGYKLTSVACGKMFDVYTITKK